MNVGGLDIQLNHAKGETDDHTWAWIPKHKAICAGDFFIWAFPNAGNPQKAQRYPKEWAAALRDMASRDAELFLPAHGLPIAGKDRIKQVLNEVATVLETMVSQTLDLMNEGASLNDIIHAVKVSLSYWRSRIWALRTMSLSLSCEISGVCTVGGTRAIPPS